MLFCKENFLADCRGLCFLRRLFVESLAGQMGSRPRPTARNSPHCQLLLLTGFRLTCMADWLAWEQAEARGVPRDRGRPREAFGCLAGK